MGYAEKWKILEDLMLELKKKSYETPPGIINDLRNAKMMIKIDEAEEGKGDTAMKLEEILGAVESDLVGAAQTRLSPEEIDEWLKRLDDASLPTCEVKSETQKTFITGVPRDQKWIRIEPMPTLPADKLAVIAKETSLSVNKQKDGRLVVYGQQENIKAFLKKMTEAAQPKSQATG
jgi:hypothetical protein